MTAKTGHLCVVCGSEIPDSHGRFVTSEGHVHQGCKSRIGSSARVSQRPNSMISYSPEAAALRYQWKDNSIHSQALRIQSGNTCCQGERAANPSVQDIVRMQTEAWTGWAAFRPNLRIHTATRAPSVGATLADGEKFLDPRLACSEYNYGAIEYLSVTPNNAKARIAAMRKKVTDFKMGDARPGRGVSVISQQSFEKLKSVSKDLYLGYQEILREGTDSAKIKDFADKMGKSVPQVMQEAPDVIKNYTGFDVRELASVAKVVWEAIGPTIMKTLKDISDGFASAQKGISDASAAFGSAEAIPFFGAIAKFMINTALSAEAASNADWAAKDKDFIQTEIADRIKKTSEAGLPIPWHALEYDLSGKERTFGSALRWTPTPSQVLVADSFKKNMDRWNELDVSLQAEAAHWWTLATQIMSVKEIEPIFAALGNNSENGGLMASDEQVMLVAAPIAVSYGFPIDEFAEKLWDKSVGWRQGGALLKPEPIKHYGYNSDNEPVLTSVSCEKEAANALQVQWGVLARDAFELADQLKKKIVVAQKADEERAQTASTARMPSILGGIATGILALSGVPLLLAAAPFAIGLLISRRNVQASQPAPEPPPAAPPAPTFLGNTTPVTLAKTDRLKDLIRL